MSNLTQAQLVMRMSALLAVSVAIAACRVAPQTVTVVVDQPPTAALSGLPGLRVLAPDRRELSAGQGSYTWCPPADGSGAPVACQHVDTTPPDPARATPAVALGIGTRLELRFDPPPTAGPPHVERWANPRQHDPVPLAQNDSLSVQGPPGRYVYTVTAKWERSTVNYGFAIDIE